MRHVRRYLVASDERVSHFLRLKSRIHPRRINAPVLHYTRQTLFYLPLPDGAEACSPCSELKFPPALPGEISKTRGAVCAVDYLSQLSRWVGAALQDSRLVSQGTRKERGFPSRGQRGERAISQDGGAIQKGRKKPQLFADRSHATNIHRDCANALP